jgi:tetratricopeptide (TPR) repeat protein
MMLWIAALQVSAAMPLLQSGRFAEARPILEKACIVKESNACYLLGRTLFTLDLYDQALPILLPLRATDPAPWRVEDALALTYEALRQPLEAETMYRLAIKGNGGRSADPSYHYGRFLIREGRAAEAIDVLAPVVKRFPSYTAARFELGRAYYYCERYSEAEAELKASGESEEALRLLEKARRRRSQ